MVFHFGTHKHSATHFTFSKFSVSNEIKNKSFSKYYIISGLPKDYSSIYLQDKARNIRNSLINNGAKKIVAVFDENGGFDERWHSGFELQEENYEKILVELMRNDELGVIFKPKAPRHLYKRLIKIKDLLNEAIKTGRCKMIDGMDKFQSSYPVTLAGLASDICVHTDLSSGTAAIECASLGKPVLLIDREGEPFSKLNELPLGTVRFRNWEDTINAIIDFKPGSKNKIGEWGDFIDQMDPFRDGLSAKRIGNYLEVNY